METKMTPDLMREVIGRLEVGTRADAEIIASLRYDNKRMRRALRKIVLIRRSDDEAGEIARAALADTV